MQRNLSNSYFGFLKVVKPVGKTKDRHILWQCQCICGSYHNVSSRDLLSGHTKSCGCMKNEMIRAANTTHGFRQYRNMPRIYKIWLGMKERCYNPNSRAYRYYGGKGIVVCDRWKNSFQAFFEWAIQNGYTDALEIDRINFNGNYEPGNCRFVDDVTQARNTNRCIYQTINGKRMCLSEIAEKYGKTEASMLWRYHK